jgi:hypothetical protein
MPLDNFVLPELVNRAKELIEHCGADALENYTFSPHACGCMGANEGETLCPCAQGEALCNNLVAVTATFDEALAKKIWLRKLVAALPG